MVLARFSFHFFFSSFIVIFKDFHSFFLRVIGQKKEDYTHLTNVKKLVGIYQIFMNVGDARVIGVDFSVCHYALYCQGSKGSYFPFVLERNLR